MFDRCRELFIGNQIALEQHFSEGGARAGRHRLRAWNSPRLRQPERLGRAKWQDDPEANAIMSLMMKLGAERDICVLPVYAVSQDAAATIVDLSATMGVDCLVIGTTQRGALTNLLRGSVANHIAENLPDSIRLVIFG